MAAVGVMLTMLGAMFVHIKRQDGSEALAPNVVILVMAAFVALGRFFLIPA